MKTRNTPIHCRGNSALPNMMTDPRMVKNLRVVVMMEVVRGPKWITVQKMKFCNGQHTIQL